MVVGLGWPNEAHSFVDQKAAAQNRSEFLIGPNDAEENARLSEFTGRQPSSISHA